MTSQFQLSINEVKKLLQAGNVSQALAKLDVFEQSAATDSLANEEQIELYYLKAVTLRYHGDISLALQTLSKLLSIAPSNARAFQEQGYCYLAQNDYLLALKAFHHAVGLNPALIGAWQHVLTLFKQSNDPRYSAANEQLQLLKSLPKKVLTAMDLMHEGKLYKAEQLCRQYLQDNKHQVDAMCLLAEIGSQLKVYDDAEFLLESCVNLYPDHRQAKAAYINLLNKLGKFEQTAVQAKAFLTTFPNVNPHVNDTYISVKATLANALVSLGQINEGINIYQYILNKHPEKSGIYLQLGHAYKTLGLLAETTKAYQQAYQVPAHAGDAYWSLANLKTYQFSKAEMHNMQQLVAQEETDTASKISMHFALGKAFEDLHQYEESFSHYKQGNAFKSQSLNYDASKTTALINQQIRHCTAELFTQHRGAGCLDSAPIFIVGLPRAGSTLIEQIIASHSQVDGTRELHNILGIALKLRGRIADGEAKYPENLWQLSTAQLKQLGETFIKETKSYRQGAAFFIDKMPNNFIHIALIKLILPNAKIIDARREPMACCFSGFKQLFGEGQEFSYNLDDIAQYYQDYQRLIAHWDQVLPGAILRVQHEQLVNNTEQEIRRILDYCQLPFEQNCLTFYQTKRNVHTPSAQQVRQPISTQGLTQWQNYDCHLTQLKTRFYCQ